MYKNLKIAINDQQPLDEVVRELERLGYRYTGWHSVFVPEMFLEINTIDRGFYEYATFRSIGWGEITTLSELKEM